MPQSNLKIFNFKLTYAVMYGTIDICCYVDCTIHDSICQLKIFNFKLTYAVMYGTIDI